MQILNSKPICNNCRHVHKKHGEHCCKTKSHRLLPFKQMQIIFQMPCNPWSGIIIINKIIRNTYINVDVNHLLCQSVYNCVGEILLVMLRELQPLMHEGVNGYFYDLMGWDFFFSSSKVRNIVGVYIKHPVCPFAFGVSMTEHNSAVKQDARLHLVSSLFVFDL